METIDYLRALRRSALLVIGCVLAGLIGAGIAVQRATPQYTTTAQLIVSGASSVGAVDEIAERELAETRATAFSQIASTQPAVEDAVTGAGYPAGTGLPSVSSGAVTNQPFLNVTVTSSDKKLAAAVANAFVKTLPSSIKRLDQVPSATPIVLSVLSPAGVPGSPSSPKKKQDLGIGALLGLILGVAIALLREVTDRTLRDSDAAGTALGITVLGVIPYEAPKEMLIAATKPRGIRTEAYRQVRTSLIAADQIEGAPPLRRLIATSATAGEGKTSLLANLAKVYSRAGHRVVIVDADLRRPRVGVFFDVPASAPGLSTVLSGTATLTDVTVVQDDGLLGIVPSGAIPSNPSEALGGAAMDTVLAELAEAWDIVLIDTPPVLPVADALILAPKVDGVILVARLGETTVDKLRRARTAIEKVNGQIVGLVPNGAKANDDSAYRYVYGRKNRQTGSYIDVVPADAPSLPASQTHEPASVVEPAPVAAPVAPPLRRVTPVSRPLSAPTTPVASANGAVSNGAAAHGAAANGSAATVPDASAEASEPKVAPATPAAAPLSSAAASAAAAQARAKSGLNALRSRISNR